jgi:hypothetical protein
LTNGAIVRGFRPVSGAAKLPRIERRRVSAPFAAYAHSISALSSAKEAPREFAWQTGSRCTDGNPMLYVDNPLPGDVIVTESFRASANVPGHGVVLERVGKGLARIPVKNDRRYSYYVRPTNPSAAIESEAGKETVRYWVRCEP